MEGSAAAHVLFGSHQCMRKIVISNVLKKFRLLGFLFFSFKFLQILSRRSKKQDGLAHLSKLSYTTVTTAVHHTRHPPTKTGAIISASRFPALLAEAKSKTRKQQQQPDQSDRPIKYPFIRQAVFEANNAPLFLQNPIPILYTAFLHGCIQLPLRVYQSWQTR